MTHSRTLVQTNLCSFPPPYMNKFKYDQEVIYVTQKTNYIAYKANHRSVGKKIPSRKKIQVDCITKVLFFVIPVLRKNYFGFLPITTVTKVHTQSHDDFLSNSQYVRL